MPKLETHPHISFNRNWKYSKKSLILAGQCEAIIWAIQDTPMEQNLRKQLMTISLRKGAIATTNIEGNTLSEEDLQEILDKGKTLPPSKEYLQMEVENVLEAMNTVLQLSNGELISPKLLKEFHSTIGQDLGDAFGAVPGRFAQATRVVGTYRAPDHELVPELVDGLCTWLKDEFHFHKGQSFLMSLTEALVAHVYLEWIHPFDDGNGRTGRLLEFYILFRAGLPDIASHILSQFYNDTRSKYYFVLNEAAKTGNLDLFIEYAVEGLRDGLKGVLDKVLEKQIEINWKSYVYDTFSQQPLGSKSTFKRRRGLILNMNIDQKYSIDELALLTPKLAKQYAQMSDPTLSRDLNYLRELELINEVDNQYFVNLESIVQSLPRRTIN